MSDTNNNNPSNNLNNSQSNNPNSAHNNNPNTNPNNQSNQNAPKPMQNPVVITPVNPNNNIVRNWLSGIAGVLVILIAITYIVHRNDNSAMLASDTGTSTMMAATTTTTAMTGTDASSGSFMMLPETMMTASQGEVVTVNSQPAGNSVSVSSMTLSRLSWVAVVAKNGSILGAGLFPASATSGTIPLQRATVAGQSYEVVIYVDNGDKTFELHQDLLVMNNDKSPVGAMFIAQ
jgi:hypothetical protein